MTSTIMPTARICERRPLHGKAALVRHIYEGRAIAPIWDALLAQANANPNACDAFMDLSIILQATGQVEKATIAQTAALGISRTYQIKHGDGSGLRVLAFVTAGDFMANTPIEFLVEKSNCTLLLYYVDSKTASLLEVPEHDVAFLAVGESPDNAAILDNLAVLLSTWQGPIVNNAPHMIRSLTRRDVALRFVDEPSISAPRCIIASREHLMLLKAGNPRCDLPIPDRACPIIIRPIGSHAGQGMSKIDGLDDLDAYLIEHNHPHYYVCPYVDYRSPDGLFRKHRIAFIDGVAFACHSAISDNWMVHYLSAGMETDAWRRAEEAEWMRKFETDFASRHSKAFRAMHKQFGLDYFAIDCAELADGRLLLFEADVAMIVHALDRDSMFPYKKEPMAKLFSAFQTALRERATSAADRRSRLMDFLRLL
jgi:hypothetical protein